MEQFIRSAWAAIKADAFRGGLYYFVSIWKEDGRGRLPRMRVSHRGPTVKTQFYR